MQILLRSYGDEKYVWKKAVYKNNCYYVVEDGKEVRVNDSFIVSAKGIKKNKVQCNFCRALIDNTPEAIEAHYKESEAKKNCFQCEHLKFSNAKKDLKRVVTKDESGLYFVKEEFASELYCGANSWNIGSIDDNSHVTRNCPHFKCRLHGVSEIQDIFHKYPGVFDTAITVDHLTANNMRYEGKDGQYFLYDMKSRGTIQACVNTSGIVECFRLCMYSTGTHYFCYSEKYDKLFYRGGNTYEEKAPYWIKECKLEEMKKKIKALYEGAK